MLWSEVTFFRLFLVSHLHLLRFVSAREYIYPKILFRIFEEKRMLFQAKQALVFKAMYQCAFLAREKVLNFDSLRKHPFLLALRRRGRFARRNVCDSATEIPY